MAQNRILHGPKLTTTFPEKSVGEFFFECGLQYADRVCQVDGTSDQTETYASVRQRSVRVAIELQKRGITPNDVILFCSGNTIDTVIPILGTFYVGAKVANLDPSLSVRQTQHLISLVLPKIIFVERESVNLIEESLKTADAQAEIIVYGESEKYATLQELTRQKQEEENFKPVQIDVDEVAVMFFSSGTTGLPKAICHSHRSFINMGLPMIDLDLGDSVLHFTTFYWITAMLMLIYSYMVGGCRVFGRAFEAETVFKTIQKYKVSIIFMAPVLSYKLTSFENAKKYDISSVKQVQCGGNPISTTQFQKLTELFNQSSILVVYGMTETGYNTCFDPKTDGKLIKTKIKSVGKPVPGLSLKIVNEETDEILGPNVRGEIRVWTESLMKGYYNADASNAFDEDGFLKTGDVGYYEEDGCVYVVERIKEMFKYQSWHIIPTAVEAVLLEHPAVKDAAVFGVPCGADGEAPGACVVLKEGQTVTKNEIFDFVANRASDREKLRGGIWFVSSLAKTPTGKLIRREIRNAVLRA